MKSISWQAMGLISMTAVGYVFTGSVSQGSGIALSGAALGFVTYFLHEHLWARVPWGKRPERR